MRIINLFCIFFILLGTTIVKAQEKSLATLINEKDVFLVDVRTPEEFAKGSATNAVNIPLNTCQVQYRGSKWRYLSRSCCFTEKKSTRSTYFSFR